MVSVLLEFEFELKSHTRYLQYDNDMVEHVLQWEYSLHLQHSYVNVRQLKSDNTCYL